MPAEKIKLLIVDDEPQIRMLLSQIFTGLGHSVRSVEDGFAALFEIRQEIPDILISDLNMPGMSGFKLLAVVRRRFPAIHAIAMSGAFSSGAFSGECVPSGVVADAFYEKGTGLGSLLQLVEAMAPVDPLRLTGTSLHRRPSGIPSMDRPLQKTRAARSA